MPNNLSASDDQGVATLDLAPRLGNLLEEYGEIATILPVLAGLYVTSRWQLRGTMALLINLTIAALVRQMVIEFKKQATTSAGMKGQPTSAVATEAVEDYMIVHSTPGRLRLRIPRLYQDYLYAKCLEELLKTDERVTKVRINRAASSLVIQYDGSGISELELGMRLLQILDQAENPSATQSRDNNTDL